MTRHITCTSCCGTSRSSKTTTKSSLNNMDLTKLTYTKEKYPLKNMGDLVSFEGTDLLSHYYDPHTFDTYIRKWIEEDDKYTYYVLFRVGFVGFISFFKKTRSLRGWF